MTLFESLLKVKAELENERPVRRELFCPSCTTLISENRHLLTCKFSALFQNGIHGIQTVDHTHKTK